MVSVIVPVYNSEKSLKKCVESILKQTYTDFELILLDDGSKDDSLKICEEFAMQDKRVVVISHENRGVAATRNVGLQVAKRKYVQFVDSDDYIEEDMIEKLVSCMDNTKADMVICGYTEYSSNYKEVRLPEIEKVVDLNKIGKEYPTIFEKFLLNSPWNKLYKKEKIKEGFPEDLSLGEDLVFNLHNMMNMNKIAFVKESYYNYIAGEGGLNKKYRENSIEIAEKLYLESMTFCNVFCVGRVAEVHISNIFMTFFFYGLTDLFTISGYDKKKKKKILNNWMKNPNIEKAAAHAEVRRAVQKVAVFLVKHKMTKALEGLFLLKSFSQR